MHAVARPLPMPDGADGRRKRLPRAVMIANPTTAVSSTRAAAPSCLSSSADISSVTRGGVSLIASAYSITSRSNGVNIDDSPQRGTSLALNFVEPFVVGLEVAKVQTERTADPGSGRHVGQRLQVGVELIPLLDLATKSHRAVEHRSVVPHHRGPLRHFTEHLPAHSLQEVSVRTGVSAWGFVTFWT